MDGSKFDWTIKRWKLNISHQDQLFEWVSEDRFIINEVKEFVILNA